ncbi:MAG: ATP synthase F1 subunit gamma [Chitinophagales bacterium]|nr:ATP synthase F1 subunit gamma [Chitinophagales bacterium]
MAGQLKEVRERIKSVKSTQQITKAMKMVSAAKLRRATDAIVQMRPYASKLSEILNNILISQEGALSSDLTQEREVRKVLIVLFTSDRGLCGGFNSNLFKRANQLMAEKYAHLKKSDITILAVGKKGQAYFSKTACPVNSNYVHLLANISFAAVSEAAEYVIEAFKNKEYDTVELVYGRFKNAAVQVFEAEPFLPLVKQPTGDIVHKSIPDFIFEPNKEQIISELIPKILKTQFYKALLDTNASEHGARMTAMDKATENAEDMLKNLRISYNRARQAAITTELTEIVSGAAALQG